MPLHRPIEKIPLPQQYFERELEERWRNSLCTPTALYYAAEHAGYEMPGVEEYAAETIKHGQSCWSEERKGWKRGELTNHLRTYGVEVVSWKTATTGQQRSASDLSHMQEAGYITNDREKNFLQSLSHRSFSHIAADYPMAVTVAPGFGANVAAHTIYLQAYDPLHDEYCIIDPDARNPQELYSSDELLSYLAPEGACSIVLPPECLPRIQKNRRIGRRALIS